MYHVLPRYNKALYALHILPLYHVSSFDPLDSPVSIDITCPPPPFASNPKPPLPCVFCFHLSSRTLTCLFVTSHKCNSAASLCSERCQTSRSKRQGLLVEILSFNPHHYQHSIDHRFANFHLLLLHILRHLCGSGTTPLLFLLPRGLYNVVDS